MIKNFADLSDEEKISIILSTTKIKTTLFSKKKKKQKNKTTYLNHAYKRNKEEPY